MPKGNHAVGDAHFRKDWQRRVRTWFDQPASAQRRRHARALKAASIFPRPLDSLRPVVHAPTQRYNMKVRLGRGFSVEELKLAGLAPKYAASVGIAVDTRRSNKSDKSLKANVQRLKQYKSKLVLFPRNNKKPKAGDANKETLAKVTQLSGTVLPLAKHSVQLQSVKLSDVDFKTSVYTTLRKERQSAKLVGVREKKAKEKAEQEASKKE